MQVLYVVPELKLSNNLNSYLPIWCLLHAEKDRDGEISILGDQT